MLVDIDLWISQKIEYKCDYIFVNNIYLQIYLQKAGPANTNFTIVVFTNISNFTYVPTYEH